MDCSSSSSSSSFCLTDEALSPTSFLLSSPQSSSLRLDTMPSLSPSPRASSSSSSSLLLLSPPRFPSSSGGMAVSEASVCFSVSQTDSFSAQVDSILRGTSCLWGPRGLGGCVWSVETEPPGNIEYSCPVASKCEITKRRRKACQACRFQKCLQAGMMREEPAPLSATQDESTNESSLSTVLTLCDLLNRQLLLLIGWPNRSQTHLFCLSGFAALSLVDQMLLLQSGWMEALLVGVAWRSQGEELVFAENLRLDEAQCRAAGLADLYEALRHLSTKYQAMNLSPEEAVMLKAMALANTAAAGRPAGGAAGAPGLQGGGAAGGRLLMSLPLLRQTADRAVRNLLRIHREQRVPLHRLLLEMML
ncbi:hypothetical protein F7725_021229 [Dissostichus mawsoni]|uniref:Uncharacterized protein n=1 Tax=Dissostichus mawsoni TaxID=36200 RepID=A0A7J5YGW1_DISMA|nr:hypothetical protein F7725_021229 [Dissostichus mawsoni]